LKDAVVIGIDPVKMTADIMYRDTHEKQRGVKIAGSVYRNLKERDFVLVDYLHGEADSPVIMNTLMLPKDPRITDEASVLDAINFIHEVKDEEGTVTAKLQFTTNNDGDLILSLSGASGSLNLNLNVEGEEGGNINILAKGALTLDVPTGAVITSEGDVTVNAKDIIATATGDAKIDASGTVELGSNLVKLILNNIPKCFYTGLDHFIGNTNVKA